MTPAERVADALLDADLGTLRALRDDPVVGAVARAGLARLAPGDVLHDLPADAVVLLQAVSGHPGLSRAGLEDLVGDAVDAADLLLERGLVASRRFDRTDCWSRTAAGAAVLRALVAAAAQPAPPDRGTAARPRGRGPEAGPGPGLDGSAG